MPHHPCRTIKAVEEILLGDKRFPLPGKKALHDGSLNLTVIVVDASEQRVERPHKNSVAAIPARKSAIRQKGQIVIDPLEQQIVCVATGTGKTHDFALFKRTRLALLPQIVLLGNTGYQGVDMLHPNSWTPFKKTKLHPLTPKQKQQNRLLASCRVTVEHVIRTLKRFRILSSTYRNRRKRFGLRLNLLAAITNLHQ